MQVSQDLTVKQYAQSVQSTGAASAAANTNAAAKGTEEVSKKGPDMDKVELSTDAKVTTKMTDAERADLVSSLKADLDNQMSRFTNMMTQMFQKQGIMASGDDFWKKMASGNFRVDAKTKAEAQAAISEDGYWGVSQTSQRIFDFAKALAGDDVEKMEKYQAAVEKGFKQAENAWGGQMPSITGQTHEAVNKLFDDYYAEHK